MRPPRTPGPRPRRAGGPRPRAREPASTLIIVFVRPRAGQRPRKPNVPNITRTQNTCRVIPNTLWHGTSTDTRHHSPPAPPPPARRCAITPRHASYSRHDGHGANPAPCRAAPSAPCWPRAFAYLRLRAARMLASARVSASGSSREPATLATSTAALAAAMAAPAACWKTRWIWAMR